MYCFGDPAKMSDEKVRLALRIHDEVRVPHTPNALIHLDDGDDGEFPE